MNRRIHQAFMAAGARLEAHLLGVLHANLLTDQYGDLMTWMHCDDRDILSRVITWCPDTLLRAEVQS